ncbi:hypothetical protein [Nocardioides aurantiacus]|uniref:Uncharacterized protein n=1 Tax=Nocardioides aurantiacus TaxID=86796 RepID=A0A3N2CTL3_9ACTN|nr:hypothetical protein [Nocardioides aurantiacus]ROR90851.1 hypothetical protein EDD33_1700 [Nocardioides aurantiacus]
MRAEEVAGTLTALLDPVRAGGHDVVMARPEVAGLLLGGVP